MEDGSTVLVSATQTRSLPLARTEKSEVILTRKQKQSGALENQQSPFLPKSFVLCERNSGAVRFHVQAGPDGSVPVEKIAGLLAVHCLVRGQAPQDFELMVIPRGSLLEAAAARAQELLAAGRALGAGVRVSRREQEVLDGVLQHLANKEIAARLHVSERTVKFHVSSLLAKFGVSNRVALSREASFGQISGLNSSDPGPSATLFGFSLRGRQPLAQETTTGDAPENNAEFHRESPRARSRLLPMVSRERFAT